MVEFLVQLLILKQQSYTTEIFFLYILKIIIDMTALGPDKKTIRADKKRRTHELYTRIMQLVESGGLRPT